MQTIDSKLGGDTTAGVKQIALGFVITNECVRRASAVQADIVRFNSGFGASSFSVGAVHIAGSL